MNVDVRWSSAAPAALRAVALCTQSNTWLQTSKNLQVILLKFELENGAEARVKPTSCLPVLKERICSSVSLLPHYSTATLLEDTEGHKRLNSSVVYSLETNQEKPQNNNPCPLS